MSDDPSPNDEPDPRVDSGVDSVDESDVDEYDVKEDDADNLTALVASIDPLPLPDELTGSPPRPIPPSVKAGPAFTRHRQSVVLLLTAAAAMLVLAPLPATKLAALYLLPLEYLFWIGLAIAGYAIAVWLGGGPTTQVTKTVRDGEVGTGQVLSLAQVPKVVTNGQPVNYVYFAEYAIADPGSGEVVVRQAESRAFSTDEKKTLRTRLRVGQPMLVVWQPGRFSTTARPYDFVEATDEHALVSDGPSTPLWLSLLVVVAAFAFFASLLWNVWALERYGVVGVPLSTLWPTLVAGAAIGLISYLAFCVHNIRQNRQRAVANDDALAHGEAVEVELTPTLGGRLVSYVVLPAGAVMLAGATCFTFALTINAWLDKSPGAVIPVEITERVQTTHSFLFRQYTVRVTVPDDPQAVAEAAATMKVVGRLDALDSGDFPAPGDKLSRTMTPDELDTLNGEYGAAIVRQGYFGWPWVAAVLPADRMIDEGGLFVIEKTDYGSPYLARVLEMPLQPPGNEDGRDE